MRLTLRTLLAYLDDILEPSDGEDIREKVDSSEFALGLVNRIRDVVQRLRLGAPKLHGQGMGIDPNTVAEYLDNTLPAERVPEFEKVCLESDIHLAEVAASHQILTLVLGEPADVVPACRERMYGIPGKTTAEGPSSDSDDSSESLDGEPSAAVAIAGSASEADSSATASETGRRKPEVPDYLREEKSWVGPLVSTAGVGILVTLLVVVVFFLVQGMGDPQVTVRGNGEVAATGVMPDGTPRGDSPEGGPPAESNDSQPPGTETEPADTPPTEPTKDLQQPDSVVNPTTPGNPADGESEASAAEPPVPGDPEPMRPGPTRPVPTTENPADAAATEPGSHPMEPMPGDSTTTESDPAEPVGDAADVPAEPAPGPPVASHGATEGLLLAYEPQQRRWERVPAGGLIASGSRMLALPTFSTMLKVSDGGTLLLLGDTRVQLQADPSGQNRLQVLSGRVTIVSPAAGPYALHVRAGNHEGELRLTGENATAAIEVQVQRIEGTDPETTPPQTEVTLYAASGEISWEPSDALGLGESSAGGKTAETATLDLDSQPDALWQAANQLPGWVGGEEEISQIDQSASDVLIAELRADRPFDLYLKEQAEHRRVEVRTLAIRCLAHLDGFEPALQALNDPQLKSTYRSAIVESLRSALSRGPETALLLRKVLQLQRHEKGEQLYRLLWGYDNQQLESGQALQLIEYLDHGDLDFRVLSFWNLSDITGMKLYYRPENSAAKRQPSISKWRQRYETGVIVRAEPGKEIVEPDEE
jgi:hypothetical protein